MRAHDGQRQPAVSGDTPRSHLFPSHTFSLLHSNKLTNVPWKCTLDAQCGGEVKAAAIAGKGWRMVLNQIHNIIVSLYYTEQQDPQ